VPAGDLTLSSGDGHLPNLPSPSIQPVTESDPGAVAQAAAGQPGGPSTDANATGNSSNAAAPSDAPAPQESEMLASNNSSKPHSSEDADSAPTPSENVTVNLIHLMVKRGLISKSDADQLIKQAEDEAVAAHEQAVVAQAQAAQAPASESSPAAPGPTPATPADSDEDTVRVAYVPDIVKEQIRDEVKDDVLKEAHEEHWAGGSEVPEWVHRFHVTGDIRVRYEGDLFPTGNATGLQTNFNAINTGSPFNALGLPSLPPTYNVDQDRQRFRLRARIGAEVDLGGGFSAGMRLASGSDNQPVTESQTEGGVNSFTQNQGGNFSKYNVWIDRAFITYELGGQPDKDFSVLLGRFDNPFFSTSMIWGDEIGFDGFTLTGKYQVADGVTPFLTAGAFPIFNTDLNFGTSSTGAGQGYSSEDKWLYATQGGVNWKIDKDWSAKGAVAFYDFENIQGQLSAPIDQNVFLTEPNFQGSTDDSRPSFAQHGNTYIPIRNIIQDTPPVAGETAVDPQYFGLASKFQVLALTGRLDYSHFDPFHISLTGEFVDNLAFDRGAIEREGPPSDPAGLSGPQNNLNGTSFAGGGQGYDIRLDLGAPALEKFGDWNVNIAYRYLESDAVVDASPSASTAASAS
jgi:hypothetical protein